MKKNPFGHLDLRVTSLADAMPLYEKLLPALGFTTTYHGEEWKSFAATGELPGVPFVAITEDPAHVANANRVAFWMGSVEEVDRAAEVAIAAGARNVEGPAACPEYSPSYYAVFFQDACGNRWEIYFRME